MIYKRVSLPAFLSRRRTPAVLLLNPLSGEEKIFCVHMVPWDTWENERQSSTLERSMYTLQKTTELSHKARKAEYDLQSMGPLCYL